MSKFVPPVAVRDAAKRGLDLVESGRKKYGKETFQKMAAQGRREK
jgi:hypothetical protein